MTLAASIVPLTVGHWPQVEAIYAAGIIVARLAITTILCLPGARRRSCC